MTPAAKLAIKIIITKLIKPRMAEFGMSIYTLSKDTGISHQSLTRWLDGSQDISLSKFITVLTVLEINPVFIPQEVDTKDYEYIHLN